MYDRGGFGAVVIFAIGAETSSDCSVWHSKMAAGDRFLPAAQRGD
jgi:hypothetical protein